MNLVNGARLLDLLDDAPASVLMGLLLRHVSNVGAAAQLDGLRPSHYRLLAHAEAPGIRITELSELLGMTKQACGQFVTQLSGTGHVAVEVPAEDRRARLVTRTALGTSALGAFSAVMTELEHGWAERAGAERYAVFLDVLRELALGPQR
jgi:DNA-binding MarR family transcriptional regulator